MTRVVTDTSVCIKRREAESLGVKLAPLRYSAGGRAYTESFADENGEYEELLKQKTDFSTSQPGPAAYLSAFEEELAAGNDVLCICISSRLSGAYAAAHAAARQSAGPARVTVFDSRLTAGGLYLLVKQAARYINDGMKTDEIQKNLILLRERIDVAFSVRDMAPLVKSGRHGLARINAATILNRRPVLLIRDGAVTSGGVARGETDMIRILTRQAPENAAEIVINFIGDARLAANIHGVLKQTRPGAEIHFMKIGPALTAHLGLNAVGVSYVSE